MWLLCSIKKFPLGNLIGAKVCDYHSCPVTKQTGVQFRE